MCLDVAGLAANLYRRNTPLIKVPTTVMAAVDASIGIKVSTCCPSLAQTCTTQLGHTRKPQHSHMLTVH